MKVYSDHQRRMRIGNRRSSEQGMTVIELLLATSILAVMTGFLVGGLWIGRRAFEKDRTSALAFETNAAIQTMASLIGSALPVAVTPNASQPEVSFDGQQDSLSFIGLSEGRSLPGGPQKFVLRRSQGDILVTFRDRTRHNAGGTRDSSPADVVILRGVRDIRFAYFGRMGKTAAPGWRVDWRRAEILPELVAISLDFEDRRRNQPTKMVALRQR